MGEAGVAGVEPEGMEGFLQRGEMQAEGRSQEDRKSLEMEDRDHPEAPRLRTREMGAGT